jgi:hypothetical protein
MADSTSNGAPQSTSNPAGMFYYVIFFILFRQCVTHCFSLFSDELSDSMANMNMTESSNSSEIGAVWTDSNYIIC